VAGIKGHYTADEMRGKQIVVVANLEPAVLRGERSDGMLLAALDGDEVVLLVADKEVSPGSKVS
jgi:methionine--tRNA ligase beta chain